MMGSQNSALMPIVEEAFRFHEFVRNSPIEFAFKGQDPLRHSCSVFRPDVMTTHDGFRESCRNSSLLNRVMESDMLIIPGEASSHCVLDSLNDLLDEIMAVAPSFVKRVYILKDCMSPVVIVPGDPNLDFTKHADEGLAKLQAAGMNLVDSTTPIEYWPYSPFAEDKG